MKRRLFAILMLLCITLCSCGKTSSSGDGEQNTQSNENTDIEATVDINASNNKSDEEATKIWNLNIIDMPDPDIDMDEIIPEGYVQSSNGLFSLSYEIVFRIFNIVSRTDDSDCLGTCIQTLEAPYTEWEYQIISPDEWVEGEYCKPGRMTMNDYGELFILLEGTDNHYVGSWSLNRRPSAKLLDCEYQITNYESWCTGDVIGNFFVFGLLKIDNYQTLWLDSEFKEKDGIPQVNGYIWELIETPISGIPYFVGIDSNSTEIISDNLYNNMIFTYPSGFTIWAEGEDEPVFTTPDAGMYYYSDIVIFYSDTEGYLFNSEGIWDFSIEDNSITKIRNINSEWHDACMRMDDSVLVLSRKFSYAENRFKYTLHELIPETLDHNK